MNDYHSDPERDWVPIPAHSRNEAMDWSLVLASQEIPTVIARSESGWQLLVEPGNYERGYYAIQQYRHENRRWRWRDKVAVPDFQFHWGGVLWSLFLIGIYAWTVYRVPAFYISGAMDSEAVAGGEWWRLFTAMLLHVDLAHLMANATLGCVLFGLSMGQYGGGYGLLLAYLAGAGGNCAGLILYAEPYRSVGASGMVMGALGLLAVHSFGYWRRLHFPPAAVFRALLAGGMLFALLGLDPASDVVAHLGGFVSGIILGAMFTFLPRGLVEKQSTEAAAWTLFAFLLLFTLTRALLLMGREV